METTRLSFTVHSFDSDAFGFLAPPALAGYLQEAAGASADALGFGFADLQRQGLFWVLGREQVVLDAPVRWGETLVIETWPSGLDRIAALRDFRIARGGAEIGRALTTWFALDAATRRPARPDRVIPEALRAQTEHVLPVAAHLPGLGQAEIDRRFRVRFADIDANLHVTNSSYLSWALEAVEEPEWRSRWVAEFDVQFLAECNLGAHVRSRSAPEIPGRRLHEIVREEDGKELARVRTRWAGR